MMLGLFWSQSVPSGESVLVGAVLLYSLVAAAVAVATTMTVVVCAAKSLQ